jgi:hypothetical protein
MIQKILDFLTGFDPNATAFAIKASCIPEIYNWCKETNNLQSLHVVYTQKPTDPNDSGIYIVSYVFVATKENIKPFKKFFRSIIFSLYKKSFFITFGHDDVSILKMRVDSSMVNAMQANVQPDDITNRLFEYFEKLNSVLGHKSWHPFEFISVVYEPYYQQARIFLSISFDNQETRNLYKLTLSEQKS